MIIASITAWLQARLGLFLGGILVYLGQKWFARLTTKFLDWFRKREREKRQKKHQEKLDRDVESGAARTEEVRENEQRWLNS